MYYSNTGSPEEKFLVLFEVFHILKQRPKAGGLHRYQISTRSPESWLHSLECFNPTNVSLSSSMFYSICICTLFFSRTFSRFIQRDPTTLMQIAVGFEHLVGPGQAYAAIHMINKHGKFLLSLLPRICMWNQEASIK
jgi:hypothetical protein